MRRLNSLTARACALEPLETRQLLAVDLLASFLASTQADISEQVAHAVPGAVVLDEPSAQPLAGSANASGFTPAQLRHAYGFDQITFNGGTIQGDGTGQTIAIVSAYHSPTIKDDLNSFSDRMGIPRPPSFIQVDQDGNTDFTDTNASWALETALDVEWAHAMAPGASILLVEAHSTMFTDLIGGAVEYARNQPNVSVISMSFGSVGEFSTQTNYDGYFNTPVGHNNVSFVASAGDGGSPGGYPAYAPNVLAVGGTTLSLNAANNIGSETGWNLTVDSTGRHGSGGGISQYEAQPSYQAGVVTQSSTFRTIPDVAFDGNPNTGVPVYDTFNNDPATPWSKIGGTSFGAPVWAALVAIADQGRALAGLPLLSASTLMSKIYSMPATNFNDVTSGNNGAYSAGVGYDLVTGRGTPKANQVVASLIGSGSIAGQVYSDANANGNFDNGETGLSGWTVYQDLNNNGSFDPLTSNQYSRSYTSPSFLPIPSGSSAGVTSTIDVPTSVLGNLVDLEITLNVNHTRDSDLQITLTSPTGVTVTLADRVGGTGANFTNTTFDDSAQVQISLGTAAFNGTYQPTTPLSALYGSNPRGTWTLKIVDNVTGGVGSLLSWSMNLVTGDPNTVSSVNGNYLLANLAAGNYKIGEVAQAPYSRTSPSGGFYNITLPQAGNVTGQSFGNQILPSNAPTSVTLMAASDTGQSSSDRITRLNNSSPANALQFQIAGTIAGATVTLYADGVVIGTATASSTTTTVTTNGSTVLTDGSHSFTARQTEPGKPQSTASAPLSVMIDTAAPTASITAVTPNPRTSPVSAMTMSFSEAVTGVDLSDLQLTRDGGSNLLVGGNQTLTSADNINFSLNNLNGITAPVGSYLLSLSSGSSPIADIAGNALTGTRTSGFTVAATVLSRLLFYDNSKYDGKVAGVNSADDTAIATDKTAYLPNTGAPATFASVSSYSRGINGLMVDIAGSHSNISAADFTFRVGNNNSPATWAAALAPISVVVRAGAGANGSDRVEIIWADSAITGKWLEVTVAANGNTRLATSDTFYFASALGDTGEGETTGFVTNSTDEVAARNNPAPVAMNIPVSNLYDYNRDGKVDSTDQLIARNNTVAAVLAPKAIVIGSLPAAPQALVSTPPASSVPSTTLPPLFPDRPATSLPPVGPFAIVASPAAVPASTPAPTASPAATPANNAVSDSTHEDSRARLVFGLTAAGVSGTSNWVASETWQDVDEDLVDLLAHSARRVTSLRKR